MLTSTPTETGSVEYDVPKGGVITVGHDPGRPGTGHGLLRVVFGRDHAQEEGTQSWVYPDAPVVYGITVLGTATIRTVDALDHLARPPGRRGSYWIRAHRADHDGSGLTEVPDGTRRYLAGLVADLVEDFITRPDAEQLTEAHHRHHAPRHAAAAEERLRDLDSEIGLWQQLREHVQRVHDHQQAWVQGNTPATADPPTHHENPPRMALTLAGERYLSRAVRAHR